MVSIPFRKSFGVVLVCCALGAFVLWMYGNLNLRVPEDQNLLTTFYAHREAFERLRRMVIEDSRHEWYFSESNLDSKMSEVRQQESNTNEPSKMHNN